MNETILTFKSRRNQAELVRTPTGLAVRKRFYQEDSYRRELAIYQTLENTGLPAAGVISAFSQTLLLTYLPGDTMLEVLEQQETRNAVDPEPWEALVTWLMDFYEATGCVMGDPNLRNFLYDPKTGTVAGVDFEECLPGEPSRVAASLAAFIRTYNPENTPVKKQISMLVLQRFSVRLNMDIQALFHKSKQMEVLLLQRRKNRKK